MRSDESRTLMFLIAILAIILCAGIYISATTTNDEGLGDIPLPIFTGILQQKGMPMCDNCPASFCLCHVLKISDKTYYLLNKNGIPICDISSLAPNLKDIQIGTSVKVFGVMSNETFIFSGETFNGIIVETMEICSVCGS